MTSVPSYYRKLKAEIRKIPNLRINEWNRGFRKFSFTNLLLVGWGRVAEKIGGM
jgi:hypothetical protein